MSSPLHSCIFPVAKYLRVVMTFNSAGMAWLLLVGGVMVARKKSVTNNIPKRSSLYRFTSSASLCMFKMSFLSRYTLRLRILPSCCAAILVVCKQELHLSVLPELSQLLSSAKYTYAYWEEYLSIFDGVECNFWKYRLLSALKRT